MSRIHPLIIGLAGALAVANAAVAAHPDSHRQDAPEPAAMNIQGEQQSWIADPHMHAFYDLTVQAFAGGPAHVDQAAFTEKSYALFRDFAVSRRMSPEGMVDHLKLIPGQVVQIAKDDPEVLKSYDNFVAAVFGPQ
ncbi:hypothetical protein [Phenylobacterium soli]|uniref:Amidohydrolase n=1 Tax=Phenylobacterium soli TaxID=2170551 RepID=A0A328AHZ7_9CAUL|nr:hypothetical protein [Phenylobacterium soli]RAK54269.1 hypothetical protein DJ017_06890 [Phenylobacterium soli]